MSSLFLSASVVSTNRFFLGGWASISSSAGLSVSPVSSKKSNFKENEGSSSSSEGISDISEKTEINKGHVVTPPACFGQIYKRHPSQSERALYQLYFIITVNNAIVIIYMLWLLYIRKD